MPQITHRWLRNTNKWLAFAPLCMVVAAVAVALGAPSASALSQEAEQRLSFTASDAPWSLTLPARHFVLQQRKVKPDGTGAYFYLIDEQSMLDVSFFLEPATNCKDSRSCRDMIRDAGNPMWEKPRNLKSGEIGDISYFEFLLPSFQGQPIKQQNMYAEFVVDGYWVDLHISKALYKPEDHKLFEELVKSIKFETKQGKVG